MSDTTPPLLERPRLLVESISARGWEWIDVVVAVALFAGLTVPAAFGVLDREGSAGAVLLFGALAALPLAVRRRWPLGVLGVIVGATALAMVAGVRFTPFGSSAGPALALAMYTVAERLPRRMTLSLLLGATAVTWIAAVVADAAHPEQSHNAVQAPVLAAGWVVGAAVRSQRAYRSELAGRRLTEADERARRGLAEERLRISREVHDVVSHSLGVIAVQAGVGRLVFESRPKEARGALAEIETLSRRALDELRLLLGTLRSANSVDADLGPAPGLADVPALVERVRTAGVDVSFDGVRVSARLAPMLELSAYRIIQEALTNVVKHGVPGMPTSLEVVQEPTDGERPELLSIKVTNELPPLPPQRRSKWTPAVPGGFGTNGMQERAAMFGGQLLAMRLDKAFVVIARLPLDSASNRSGR